MINTDLHKESQMGLPSHGNPSSDRTRAMIAQAALQLFADQGVDSTPIRAINKLANCRHQSAVYYHFGSKEALLEEVIAWTGRAFGETLMPVLDELATQAQRLSVDDILRPVVLRLMQFAVSTDGRPHVRLMTQLVRDGIDQRQAWLTEAVHPQIRKLEELLGAARPDLSQDVIEIRVLYFLSGFLHLMSTRGIEQYWLGNTEESLLNEQLVDYFTGAVGAPYVSGANAQHMSSTMEAGHLAGGVNAGQGFQQGSVQNHEHDTVSVSA